MMEVVVSNVQLMGSVDALHSKFDALISLFADAHPGLVSGRSDDGRGSATRGAEVRDGGSATNSGAITSPPVRRTRKKSEYNRFMSSELAKLKEEHPQLGHRVRFSMAVKAWKQVLADRAREGGAAREDEEETSVREMESCGSDSAH